MVDNYYVQHELQTNITQSLNYFLKYETYARSGATSYATNTLTGFFADINIILGYPDSLDKLQLPAIAITEEDIEPMEDYALGMDKSSIVFPYSIYGFYGGKKHDTENRQYKQMLASDLKQLLEAKEYIYYHEYPNFDSGADLQVSDVRLDYLPATGDVPADRHRFVISFDLIFMKG
jgi:hypothetical protein